MDNSIIQFEDENFDELSEEYIKDCWSDFLDYLSHFNGSIIRGFIESARDYNHSSFNDFVIRKFKERQTKVR